MVQKWDGDRVDLKAENAQSPAILSSEALLAQPGANQYLKAAAKLDLPPGLPGADELLKQLNEKNAQPLYDKAEKPGNADEVPSLKSWRDVIKRTNEEQHKIAEKARKDPHVKKVTESVGKNDGGIETVTIEKKDGTVIIHGADGSKTIKIPGGPTIVEKNGTRSEIKHDADHAQGQQKPQPKPNPKH
jgi:hypothetical protein